MRFLHAEDSHKELTYEDVFLVPSRSEIQSRMDVDIRPRSVPGLTVPIMVANMTAASGKRMAETVARRGGLSILPQDYSLERMREIVTYVKSRHHMFETPVVVDEHESIQTALNLIYKRSHRAVIVVDNHNQPVGIFTEKDAEGHDRHAPIAKAMSHEIVAIEERVCTSPRAVFEALQAKRVRFAPIVDAQGSLLGVMTREGCVRSALYTPAMNAKGELLTAVAVGARQVERMVPALLEMGVDLLVLDTAHGHQTRMIEAITRTREIIGPDAPLAAGNVATGQGAEDLVRAGASIVKVGIGPGAMCSTRMATGVGRPQFSAVHEAAVAARALGAHVWADGGIRHPRDAALAIAAGADVAFFGSWFAGTYESPADILFDEKGQPYKSHHGMASSRAVLGRNTETDEFTRAQRAYFEEGINSSRMYLKPGYESAEDIIDAICAGLRSSCTYAGARSLSEFSDRAVVGVQTGAGYFEGKPLRNWS